MITLTHIQELHAKVKSGADFPRYIEGIKTLGITHYDHFTADGKTIYYGADNFVLSGPSKYPSRLVSDVTSRTALQQALSEHQQGHTSYLTFCEQATEVGVEKWTTNLVCMEVSYKDKKGNILLREAIPQA